MKPHGTKVPENVSGPFFVTSECISCAACWELAPGFIKSHPVNTYAYFYRQPHKEEDLKICKEALEVCPVDCIYNDSRKSDR